MYSQQTLIYDPAHRLSGKSSRRHSCSLDMYGSSHAGVLAWLFVETRTNNQLGCSRLAPTDDPTYRKVYGQGHRPSEHSSIDYFRTYQESKSDA
jgi:hypothetical protein